MLGALWALWHAPLRWPYSPEENIGFGFWVVAGAFILTWVYNCTGGSLLPVLLLHASVDMVPSIIPPRTETEVLLYYGLTCLTALFLVWHSPNLGDHPQPHGLGPSGEGSPATLVHHERQRARRRWP